MLMLVPYLVSIAVGSTILTIFSKEYLDTTRQIAAKGQAKQAMEYNSALQKYLDENYETLKTAQSFEVSAALLKQQGRLPSYFPDKNNYGEAYISYVTPVTTASGKIILKSVTGIGSSKMGADMNRYLALATGSPLAGVTQDGKMYGLNNSYTMDSTHDLSKNGNVHVLAMSGGDYMQDIKLAPGYSSVEAYTPNNAGLSGPINFPPPPPPPPASGNLIDLGDGLLFDISTGQAVGAGGNTVDGASFIDAAYMAMFGRTADAGGATVYLNMMQESGAATVNSNGTITINNADAAAQVLQASMNYATTWGTESNVSSANATAILGNALASASQYTAAATVNGATAAQLVSTASMDALKNEVIAAAARESAAWEAQVRSNY